MQDSSDFLDDFEPSGSQPVFPYFRWIILIAGIIVIWILASLATNVWTDVLWFQEVGYLNVFVRIFAARVLLFIFAALIICSILVANIYFAYRFSPTDEDAVPLPNISVDSVAWLRYLLRWTIVLFVFLCAIIFGVIAANSWEHALRFWNSLPFQVTDPLFHKDVSFYVFSLPMLDHIQMWLVAAVILGGLLSIGIYTANFALSGFRFTLTSAIKGHLSGLAAILFLLFCWGYWFDIYGLVYSDLGASFGASYTDVHARLPVLRLLMGVSFIGAIVLFYNIFRQSIRLAIIVSATWIGIFIIGMLIFPGIVQRFQVEPNEFAVEQTYIDYSIDMTRKAYALDRIDIQSQEILPSFDETLVQNNPLTINNIRLWDHRPLLSLYNQIQFFELYYAFRDIDVDRYMIDGDYRQVMIGAREITGPPPDAQTWVNQKLQYTHGYGVAMSPTTEITAKGEPEFFIEDIPPSGVIPVSRPQIYYGELTNSYVIVNTEQKELDHPGEFGPTYGSYDGNGGIKLNSLIKRGLFAWRFGDLNLVVSDAINSSSKLLMKRNIQERVSEIAPFLTLDRDPYIIVDDKGHLLWIQDAYTRTSQYPYSEPFSPNTNYVRNSVKVVVDAYDGQTDFYVSDETDGIIQTYQSIFPDLFKPFDSMPTVIRDHLRYPQDFFETQAQMFLKYHMIDSQVFYNEEDLWETPMEVFEGDSVPMEPYYVMMRLPGEEREEFVLIFPFTPYGKPNLAGWMAARNDGEHYGHLVSFAFQAEGRVGQIDGPAQIEAAIASNAEISAQFTLWRGSSDNPDQGADVLQGNLLVIPIGETLIYAEPIYLQPKSLQLPSLTGVILVSQDQEPVMGTSLEDALSKMLAQGGEGAPVTGEQSTNTSLLGGAIDLQGEIKRMQNTVNALRAQVESLNDALDNILDLTREEK
ncbi:MAG: UPF0182 family protein [SAR202 cluster bacterium]|nr:UPF0182 family protein [SAR202 cluster bacterium]|tara:strand:+ start:7131 stop:9887 length:2757 start_codon:yes stop_codon:yes gene_type:complete